MKIVSYSTERINHAQGNSCNTPKKLYHVAINTMTIVNFEFSLFLMVDCNYCAGDDFTFTRFQ